MSNFAHTPKTGCSEVKAKCETVLTVCGDLHKKRTKHAVLELFWKRWRKLLRLGPLETARARGRKLFTLSFFAFLRRLGNTYYIYLKKVKQF